MVKVHLLTCLLILLLLAPLSYSQGFREFDSAVSYEKNIDVILFRTLNNNRCNFLNTIIPITDKSVLPLSISLPLGIMTVSRINNNYYDENSGLLLLMSEITGAGITFGIKQLVKRERPFVTLKNVYHNKYNSLTDRYSFPSSHTTTAFSMATSLTLRYPDKPVLIAVSYLYAAIVGYGRIYLGVHYPLDVLSGMLIGSGSAALVHSLRKEIIDLKNTIFNEKNKPDINNAKDLSTPLILGFTVGIDLLNNLIQNTSLKNNVLFVSGQNEITARINF